MLKLYLIIFLSLIFYPIFIKIVDWASVKINKRKIISKNYIDFKNMVENNYLLSDLFYSLKKHNIKNIKEVHVALLCFDHLLVLKKPSKWRLIYIILFLIVLNFYS